jgi:squalene-hopene/tetraprenyl-beta-curcumene cyclase
LEATPLTSFVAMSLIPLFGPGHPVAAKCLSFIERSQRRDGSWPIDTNLSVWVTTAAVSALASAGELSRIDGVQTARWIEGRQYREPHPYTNARPGGWGWTHLPGGVPDVDDTSGAMLALQELQNGEGAGGGVEWLLSLQNGDGGWPTFCRGWGRLPFDKSSPDLTAHAIRALHGMEAASGDGRIQRAVDRGFRYLSDVQRADGSWLPLWFGNQQHEGQANPVLGTALVLGFVAYGLSIYFYVHAQRELGAARTSAYYALSPFFGVLLSLAIFAEPPGWQFYAALAVMAAGAYFASAEKKNSAWTGPFSKRKKVP